MAGNPYHDSRGRFTSRSGARGRSGSSPIKRRADAVAAQNGFKGEQAMMDAVPTMDDHELHKFDRMYKNLKMTDSISVMHSKAVSAEIAKRRGAASGGGIKRMADSGKPGLSPEERAKTLAMLAANAAAAKANPIPKQTDWSKYRDVTGRKSTTTRLDPPMKRK